MKNIFSETIADFGTNEANWSKKNSTAKNLNFNHFGELVFYIHEQFLAGKNFAEISVALGKERHFAGRLVKHIDFTKAITDLNTFKNVTELRQLVSQGASKRKACELLNIHEIVGVYYLHTFNRKSISSVAHQKSLTANELEDIIGNDIIESNLDFTQTAKKNSMTVQNTQRYFLRYVRKRLGSSDT